MNVIKTNFLYILFFSIILNQGNAQYSKPFTVSSKIPIYVGINNTLSNINNFEGILWGFEIGTLFKQKITNNTYYLKLAGTWLNNNIDILIDQNSPNSTPIAFPFQLKYGGIKLGYTAFSDWKVQPSFDIYLAGGTASLLVDQSYFSTNKSFIQKKYMFITVAEPQLNVETFLTDFMKAGIGISYRNVFNVTAPWIGKKDLNSFAFHGMIKIGDF